MKILSAKQMQEADLYTMQHEPISSIDLMERASKAAFTWLSEFFGDKFPKEIVVFCGVGNNGGDGLVVARLLSNHVRVHVYVVAFSKKQSIDFTRNLERIQNCSNVQLHFLNHQNDLQHISISENTWLIDAIFGYGLNRPPSGIAAACIKWMNQISRNIIAIDIPSGLFADDNRHFEAQYTIKATHTLTFQAPKLAFFFDKYSEFVGTFHVLEIGLDANFIQQVPGTNFWLTLQTAKHIFRPRPRVGHKGTFGHALLVVGSYGKIGAAILSAQAALRSGLGLLTVRVPACGYTPLQTALPEAMLLPDEDQQKLTPFSEELIKSLTNYQGVGIGCGIGAADVTQRMLWELLQKTHIPIVLDADALNIIAQNRSTKNDWLDLLPKKSILTPHPKEFERLFGSDHTVEARHERLRSLAQDHQLCILLKGAYSTMALPNGQLWHSSGGDIGMATGGSGDVLTGILTSLLAQGYSPEEALLLGVFLHGKAGEYAAKKYSSESMLPSDLIACLANVFKLLNKNEF